MSWIRDVKPSWIHSMITSVLKSGPIPRHVAFIMDGNRRFAQKIHCDRSQGHVKGFDKLSETLEWCLDLGITEVTIYAFSIENFRRSREEVDGLMDLAREKVLRFMEEKDMIMKHGICIRVLGNLNLLPLDIQQKIAECVSFTKNNKQAVLNVCFSYTSREEMCFAAHQICEGVSHGLIHDTDIDESLFEQCLYTQHSTSPDLLIRTSGEVRLSDFLLWQTSYSPLSFVPVLWPEYSRWHFYAAVFFYQRQYPSIMKAREERAKEIERVKAESVERLGVESMSHDEIPTNHTTVIHRSSTSITSHKTNGCVNGAVGGGDNLGINGVGSHSNGYINGVASHNGNGCVNGNIVVNGCASLDGGSYEEKEFSDLDRYREEKNRRLDKFFTYLQEKEDEKLKKLCTNKELLHNGNGTVQKDKSAE